MSPPPLIRGATSTQPPSVSFCGTRWILRLEHYPGVSLLPTNVGLNALPLPGFEHGARILVQREIGGQSSTQVFLMRENVASVHRSLVGPSQALQQCLGCLG